MPSPEKPISGKRNVADFATLEGDRMSVLVIRSTPGMPAPTSARWLPNALELSFAAPHPPMMVFAHRRFRAQWASKLPLVLFQGVGDLLRGATPSRESVIAVPVLAG